jgi:hypothetical protein
LLYFKCRLLSLARDTTAPLKKKAKKDAFGGIVADWESRRKPTLTGPAAASSADSSNTDDNSMVKNRGIVSDDELDNVERKALAKEPTKFQKGGKAKTVIDCFINHFRSNYEPISQPNIIKISSITTSAQPMTKKEA